MRRAAVAAIIATLALAGCAAGEDEPSGASSAESSTPPPSSEAPSESASESPSETASEAPTEAPSASESMTEDSHDSHEAIEIEIEGDKVTPNGKRVKVPVGEPVLLEIDSDRAGELHVHSNPEQTPAFKKGESTLELTIDRPGIVDVEEHESGVVILQLEVS